MIANRQNEMSRFWGILCFQFQSNLAAIDIREYYADTFTLASPSSYRNMKITIKIYSV